MSDMNEMVPDWRHSFQKASSEPNPNQALYNLFDGCLHYVGASTGRLFALNKAKSTYDCFYQIGCGNEKQRISVDVLNNKNVSPFSSLLEEVIAKGKSQRIADLAEVRNSKFHSGNAKSRILIPIQRGKECFGILYWFSVNWTIHLIE